LEECGSLSAALFDKLEEVARLVRGNNQFFGGIRLLFVGDLKQLGPCNDVTRDPGVLNDDGQPGARRITANYFFTGNFVYILIVVGECASCGLGCHCMWVKLTLAGHNNGLLVHTGVAWQRGNFQRMTLTRSWRHQDDPDMAKFLQLLRDTVISSCPGRQWPKELWDLVIRSMAHVSKEDWVMLTGT
jgi:hypothetical protein